MATQQRLDAALAWATAQVGKPYQLDAFGDKFDCSTYMSGIATMIRDGVAKRWFTTWDFNSGEQNPLAGWERNLQAPFMIGITDEGVGHTGGTLLGVELEATAAGNRVVRMGDIARGAQDPMYQYVYGYRPSILDATTPSEGTMPDSYAVKAGDTLTGISASTGVAVDTLGTLNNLVPVGADLIVVDPATPPPVPVPKTYVAVSGDTWTSIAAKNGISVDTLLALNGVTVAPGSSYIVGTTTSTPGVLTTDQVLFTGKDDAAVQGEGKAFCDGAIRKALGIMGLPVTDAWVNGYLTIASRESAYNAKMWRVNTTDSNAIGKIVADGNPFQCSRGAWQCIPQTFAAYHQAGTSLSIYDPVANCAASMNYVRHVYKVADNGSNLATAVQQANPNMPPKGY